MFNKIKIKQLKKIKNKMEKNNLVNNNYPKEKYNELLFNKKAKKRKISLNQIYDNLYKEKSGNLKISINTDRTNNLKNNNKTNISKIFTDTSNFVKKHLYTKNLVINQEIESIPKKYSSTKTYFRDCSASNHKKPIKSNDNINFMKLKFLLIPDSINDSSISLREKYRQINLNSFKNNIKKDIVKKSTEVKNIRNLNKNKSNKILKYIKNNIFKLNLDNRQQFSEKKIDIFTHFLPNFTKIKNTFNKTENKKQFKKLNQKIDIDDKSCQCEFNYNILNLDLVAINKICNVKKINKFKSHSEKKLNTKKYVNINVGLLSELLKKNKTNIQKL